MKQCIRLLFLSLIALAVFSTSFPAFAAATTTKKGVTTKNAAIKKTVTTKKKTSTKKKSLTKKKVIKKKKEALNLNPPLIDPANPPGGR